MAEILKEGTVARWNLTKLYVQFLFNPIMLSWDKENIGRTSQYIVKLRFIPH